MDMQDTPDFDGKIVEAWVDDSSTTIFESPHFQPYAGRLFLTGRSPKDDSWDSGLSYGIAWDKVVSYRIYENSEDRKQRFAHFRKSTVRTAKRQALMILLYLLMSALGAAIALLVLAACGLFK